MAKAIIVAVRKDENGVITHVKSRAVVKNETDTLEQILMKSHVIMNITKLHVQYTVPNGTKVHVAAGSYLRTDGNETEADNLGELPTF